jgi:hypothetical protein
MLVGAVTMRSFLNTPQQPVGPEHHMQDSYAGAVKPGDRSR